MNISGGVNFNSTISKPIFKNILLYTSLWGVTNWNLRMGTTIFEQCSVKNCLLTHNPKDLKSISEFDAILFHYADIEKMTTLELKLTN